MEEDIRLQLSQLLVLSSSARNFSEASYIEQLAPILREALDANRAEELSDTLQELEAEQDAEIREFCDAPGNPFSTAASQLVNVQSAATQIGSTAKLIASQMARGSDELIDKGTRQLTMNRTRANIESALNTTRMVLQALEHTNQIHAQLKARHYVAAVQNLQDLQGMELGALRDLGLGAMISSAVPALVRLIKQSTLASLEQSFFATLETLVVEVGATSTKLLARQREQWAHTLDRLPHLKPFRFNSPVERAYRQSTENFLVESRLGVDLSALYEADLVFSKLGETAELAHFVDSRLDAVADELVASHRDKQSVMAELPTVTGFCLINRVVSRELPRVRNAKRVNDAWERLAQHISAVMSAAFPQFAENEDDEFLPVRQRLCSLLEMLCNFGFNVDGITVLLRELLQRLADRLVANAQRNFDRYWEEGDHMQMVLANERIYEDTVAAVWTPHLPGGPYPRAMPFSEIYPLVCRDVRTLIEHLSSFYDQFQRNPGIVEATLLAALDTLLRCTVADKMTAALRTANREQIIQIYLDLQQFQIACSRIGASLVKNRGNRGIGGLDASASAFSDAAKQAESRIFELVVASMRSFFEDASYDWQATTVEPDPSQYALDVAAYLLSITNSMLVRLPPDIRSLVYIGAADQISVGLVNVLKQADGPISPQALQKFRQDFDFLEASLAGLGGEHDIGTRPSLRPSEIDQTITLLQSADPTEYNNPQIRMRKYDRVAPEAVSLLLSKISSTDTPITSPRTPQSGFMRYFGDRT